MNELQGKKILIGVTGGIAAYKAVEVASRLKKLGAEIRIIMTRAATEFVSPRTFQEISKNPVAVEMFTDKINFNVEHIALANFADAVLIAPATANFLAKAAHGIADDLLTTTVLATAAPLLVAPSMNTNMLENPATQKNIKILENRGVKFIDAETGLLACGINGKGRLAEPENICKEIVKFFAQKNLTGKKIIVTAGGTQEPIDPVRFIGNRSSGKMGYEIAKAAQLHGAEVILISGNATVSPPANVKFVKIETAEQMREKILAEFDSVDAVIMSAAVSDYRVKNVAAQKIKKDNENLTLELVKNPDILKELGRLKKNQLLVGFAAETQNVIEYAKKKIAEKNLDFIVANDVSQEGAGFSVDTNIISIINNAGQIENFPKTAKSELAEEIILRVAERLSQCNN